MMFKQYITALFVMLSASIATANDGQGDATFNPNDYSNISGGEHSEMDVGGSGNDRKYNVPPEDTSKLVKWISKMKGCLGGSCRLAKKLHDAFYTSGFMYHENLSDNSTTQAEQQKYINRLVEKHNGRLK